MQIALGTTNDEKNKLNKTISNITYYEGTLKESSSIINPTILINDVNLSGYNYLYIPEFNRYYFITDIISVRNGLWRINAKVDVLMSFRNQINNCFITLSDTESNGKETYISGDVWKSLVKSKTDIITFPSGLNTTGEYILITSGG